ncbi:catechol 2,3-dioxygenase-like lactoylglutathione lyase family enzyme [Kibdelosporangium banguiense]|uniref:Catechol 2,3-dioxygenase-like lactoylglutathione lyase family enzyme n=1 Tax=Kibdelosporangium banguiense TaxID=1365924 RepID=A0ABS4THI6_9PSEU|nr:VOC family protein [Kibdelosporangium banguiense]MBP2323902.1 catechol 2,3-dioxygenase-like lactoylglutathione lyase family enzyme [Kibdelosporangium banguiense]
MFVPVTSILVDDQDKALAFYTDVLGFVKKTDIPVGDAKWLTVVSPDAPDGVELLLEPDGNPGIQINGKPAAQVYKKTLYDAGMPFTMLGTTDLQKDYERMTQLGARFTMEPAKTDFGAQAVFDDTCGNLIVLVQKD